MLKWVEPHVLPLFWLLFKYVHHNLHVMKGGFITLRQFWGISEFWYHRMSAFTSHMGGGSA